MTCLERSAVDDLTALVLCMTDLYRREELNLTKDLWDCLETIQDQVNLGTGQLIVLSCGWREL